jgi:hypothetical protein
MFRCLLYSLVQIFQRYLATYTVDRTGLDDVEDPTLSRHTDGGEVITLMRRPLSTLQKHFSVPGTHFC